VWPLLVEHFIRTTCDVVGDTDVTGVAGDRRGAHDRVSELSMNLSC
jgi:hypothetical protein